MGKRIEALFLTKYCHCDLTCDLDQNTWVNCWNTKQNDYSNVMVRIRFVRYTNTSILGQEKRFGTIIFVLPVGLLIERGSRLSSSAAGVPL